MTQHESYEEWLKTIIISILLILGLSTLSCEFMTKGSEGDYTEIPENILLSPSEVMIAPDRVIFFDPLSPNTLHTDKAKIEKIFLVENILYLQVIDSGGCSKHNFHLLVSKWFRESDPVQASIYLSHKAHKDASLMPVRRKLAFDLMPIRELYRRYYGRIDPITLVINEPGEFTGNYLRIRYE